MPFGSRAFPRRPFGPSGVRWGAPNQISCDALIRSLSHTWSRLQRLRKLPGSSPPLALQLASVLPRASKVPFHVLRFPGYVLPPRCFRSDLFGSAWSSISTLLSMFQLLRGAASGFSPAARFASRLAFRFCFTPETRLGFPAVHFTSLCLFRRTPAAPLRCLPFALERLSGWPA